MKYYLASLPETLRVDEKHLREHYILNVCGVAMTTNHKVDASICRRTIAAIMSAGATRCWRTSRAVTEKAVRVVRARGLRPCRGLPGLARSSGFDPKAPPPKTPAFWAIVDANRAPEDAELADVLDALNNPDAASREGQRRHWRVARRSQEPACYSASARTMRLRARAQRLRRRRTVQGWRKATGDLCEERAHSERAVEGGESADEIGIVVRSVIRHIQRVSAHPAFAHKQIGRII